MSTYIHCHIGQIPPYYLIDSMKSIDFVDPNSEIVLITDQDIEMRDVTLLQVKDISSQETQRVMNMNLFANDLNPLWRTSIFRIFLVRDSIRYLNLKSCFHFDSDVLLFQPSNLFENSISNFDGLYITPCNNDELVFGFSRFGGLNKIDELCFFLCEIVFDENKQRKYSVGMPNEMQLLGGIYKERPDLIQKLITIPVESSEFVFDPSSYGQYFGGTHQGHPPGWFGEHHNIGKQISNQSLKPKMIDKKPYVEYNGKQYPIVNLHIHSKNTKDFII